MGSGFAEEQEEQQEDESFELSITTELRNMKEM